MNIFDPTHLEKLTALLIYKQFKKPEGLDAFYIADFLGMNSKVNNDSYDETVEVDELLKDWIRLGGKVNFSWIENHGPLEWLTMGQYPFENIRNKDPVLYAEMKVIRDKSNKRWSNDWKQIRPKILTAKSLKGIRPSQDSLELSWQSMVSFCARNLQLCNMPAEAKKIQELSLKTTFNLLKN